MGEKIDIKTFTVSQIKDWLYKGIIAEGLSAKVIEKTRAHAIVNNPFAKDDMVVSCALYVDDEVVAFTSVFPDVLLKYDNRQIFWDTTLWVNPDFRGMGYAFCVLGRLAECYPDSIFDIDAVDETNANLQYLGNDVEYFKQYHIYLRKIISRKTLRGKAAYLREALKIKVRAFKKSTVLSEISKMKYMLEYVNFIDDDLYGFIEQNSSGYCLTRSNDVLNWILSHSFMLTSPLKNRCIKGNEFGSDKTNFQFVGVKVFDNGRLVGFYILRESELELSVKYIYSVNNSVVYASVLEHLLNGNYSIFTTNDNRLYDFVAGKDLHSKTLVEKKSFSHPKWFPFNADSDLIQAGDGDMIT